MHNLLIYNSLSRNKELFKPLHEGRVGMYVCGPTVYGDAHLGHARPAITFDILYRYLTHLGYKVRYVRNITDVGHLEHDADEGEDKIAKKARLEQLEPMEVVQHYLNRYHKAMERLNVLPPSIEPHASGHIIEQIEYIKKILEAGFAYESNGSVYFDVPAYNAKYHYGKLSGRNIEELRSETRALDGQSEKRNPADFALWKKASPEHIMRWPSPWSDGFPGWHLECSTMSEKYLGAQFDIHGGGIDLKFPHHECEIAQTVARNGKDSVHYWMHNNMITINGQKMGKSLGNFITLDEFFNGTHEKLERAYSPMTIRLFILMAHYRSTVDFSNEALQASEKALERLMDGWHRLQSLTATPAVSAQPSGREAVSAQPSDRAAVSAQPSDREAVSAQPSDREAVSAQPSDREAVSAPALPGKSAVAQEIARIEAACSEAMDDDLNTPIVIANLFEAASLVNKINDGHLQATTSDIEALRKLYQTWLFDILGILDEQAGGSGESSLEPYRGAVDLLLQIRGEAKAKKDWATSDLIRDQLASLGFDVKDTKNGAEWSLK